MSFKPFGSVKVEWPGKADGRHLHHPPKGEVLSVFNIFHTAKKVIAQKAEVENHQKMYLLHVCGKILQSVGVVYSCHVPISGIVFI